MKVAIAGAGIMGLCAARALVKRGHRVAVYDRGPIPNPLASSFDDHRLIRYPYGAQQGYAAMIDPAFRAWAGLWEDLGVSYYRGTGTLVLSRQLGGWAADSARVLDALGHPYTRIAPGAIEERFPFLDASGLRQALYLKSGGFLQAADILLGLAGYLERAGAALHPNTAIRRVDHDAGVAFLEDGTAIQADLLVVAAGAWSPALAPTNAPPLVPSRQVVVYLNPPLEQAGAWTEAPMLLDIDPDSGFYLVPPRGDKGLKIGDHRFSMRGDPDATREATDEEVDEEVNEILAAAKGRLRGFDRFSVERAKVCFYTVAPEERFYVGRAGRTWTMAGFSGHGFKFGALMGDRLAEAIDGSLSEDVLARWAAGW